MKPQWTALTNATLGVLMAGINTSIVLIALPAIFRGLGVNPRAPGNTSLLLWILMSYMVGTTTVLVSARRASDIFGRVRSYTIGFAIFTVASALLTATWSDNVAGAIQLVIFRVIQGIGTAFLFANSAAIITVSARAARLRARHKSVGPRRRMGSGANPWRSSCRHPGASCLPSAFPLEWQKRCGRSVPPA